MKKVAIITMSILVVVAAYIGVGPLHFLLRSYGMRCRDCGSAALLSEVCKRFSLPIPRNVLNIKTAKSRPTDGLVNFVIRFDYAPNDEKDAFFVWLNTNFEVGEYTQESDLRHKRVFYPKWFRQRIQRGIAAYIDPDYIGTGDFIAYIDSGDPARYRVYIQGCYSPSFEVEDDKGP